jgi:hypothetical protein
MYSLRSYFLKSKSFKVRTLPGCSVLTIENQKGACNQGKNWRNFYSVQSLVDTRLVNSIRAFVYAFIVELMHQRKHRHFASLRLKTMIVQARFARPSWTSGFLVLQGLDALDHRFLLPFTFRYRSKLQRTSYSRPVILLRS